MADDVREKLATALDTHTPMWNDIYDEMRCTCGADLYPDGIDAHRVDALLPVVDEIAGKRAAEELRVAAARVVSPGDRRDLRRRAAALDANPTREPVAHNHTRFRNDAGPWSPCPVSCPAAGLLR